MDIYVLDGLNGPIDLIDTFASVIWNVQWYGQSDLQLVVPGTAHNVSLLTRGRLLVRDIDRGANGTYKNVMKITGRRLDYNAEQGWTLTVQGSGLKSIVGQRVVWTQTNLSGSVESGIRRVITDNLISPTQSSRRIQGMSLAAAAGITDTFEAQLLGENIAEWLETVCKTYGIGWDVYITNGGYVFELKQGVDRSYSQSAVTPVVFSPEYDNLASASYEEAPGGYKNAAVIAGEGEGANQTITTVGTASGLERYETYVDGSGVSSNGEIITQATYVQLLKDYGAEQLAEITAEADKIDGSIIDNGLFVLGVDYNLGDLVQIDNINGISAKSRVIELIYAEDANGESLVPTFSDWEV